MNRKPRIDTMGATVLVSFSALLGLNQVLIKLVNAGMEPIFQAGLRSACAFLPVLVFALWRRARLDVGDGSLLPGIVTGILFAAEFIMLFVALEYTSVARVSILFYTMPLWLALGAHFFIPGERLSVRRSSGLLLAFIGITLALSRNENPVTENAVVGDLLSLSAAILWAAIALTAKISRLVRSTPEMQLLYQLGVSAPVMLTVALLHGDILREPTIIIWSIFAFQVIVVVAIGFLSWFWVLSIYPAADMAVYSFLAPVFGVFFGWIILHEAIGANVLIALLCVASGIVLVNWRSRESRAEGGK